jgi:hypothetical protein
MSAGWPRNVIVAKKDAAPLASGCENPPIGDEHRSVDKLRLTSGVSLRVFTEMKGEGS